MKVVHVTTYLSGGAFRGLKRLHLGLLNKGIDSYILYLHKGNENINVPNVIKFTRLPPTFRNRLKIPHLISKLSRHRIKETRTYLLKHRSLFEVLSFPFTGYDISSARVMEDADVINLHWVSNFLDYSTFFSAINKPVVWTLRDMNPFLGCVHYRGDIERNRDLGVGRIDELLQNEKAKYVNARVDLNLNLVGISEWIKEESKRSKVFRKFPHHCINNCLNMDRDMEVIDKRRARKILGLPEGLKIFCFASSAIENYRKGFDIIKEVFSDTQSNGDVLVLTFGQLNNLTSFIPGFLHLGLVKEEQTGLIYSACDALLFPSREEAFGNVMLEAMSCGLPVIAFPSGGPVDVIKDGFNGLMSDTTSVDGFKKAVRRYVTMKNEFCRQDIIDYVRANFSEQMKTQEYISLYENILEKR